MREVIKRLIAVCAGLVLCAQAFGAGATQAYATEASGSLSLTCLYDSKPVAWMVYTLYRVGSWTDDGRLELDEAWAQTGVSLEQLGSASEWRSAAEKLATYAKEQQAASVAGKLTDEAGKLTFSGLEDGLYLLVPEVLRRDEGTYSGVAELLTLPSNGESSLVVEPKIGYDAPGDEDPWINPGPDEPMDGKGDGQDEKNGGPLSWTGDATIPVAIVALLVFAGVTFVLASRRRPGTSDAAPGEGE